MAIYKVHSESIDLSYFNKDNPMFYRCKIHESGEYATVDAKDTASAAEFFVEDFAETSYEGNKESRHSSSSGEIEVTVEKEGEIEVIRVIFWWELKFDTEGA